VIPPLLAHTFLIVGVGSRRLSPCRCVKTRSLLIQASQISPCPARPSAWHCQGISCADQSRVTNFKPRLRLDRVITAPALRIVAVTCNNFRSPTTTTMSRKR
jgi:hypothetical protein